MTVIISYSIVLYTSRSISRTLKSKEGFMSQKTIEAHEKLTKVMILQVRYTTFLSKIFASTNLILKIGETNPII